MKYIEYRKSSIRHLKTCQKIIDCAEKENIDLPTSIIQNLYYLSGYIFECIINYAIFDYIGFNKNSCVDELNSKNENFEKFKTYKVVHNIQKKSKGFRTMQRHNFQDTINFFIEQNIDSSNVPFIGKEVPSRMKNLFINWDISVRYETMINIKNTYKQRKINLTKITYQDIKEYIKLSAEFQLELLKITGN